MCIYIGFILNCVQQTVLNFPSQVLPRISCHWGPKIFDSRILLPWPFTGHNFGQFQMFPQISTTKLSVFAFSHVLEIFKYCVPDRLSSGRAGWRITLHCELLWARAEHHRYQRRNHQEATARLVLVTNHNTSRKQCHKKLTKVSWNISMFLKGTFYMSKIEAANLLLRSSF